MSLSFWVNNQIDNDYAATIKIRSGYEVRDYTKGIWIGKEIAFDKALWWKEIDEVKDDLLAANVEFVEYPYFIRQNKDGSHEVFFDVVKGSHVESFEGFSVAFPLTNTAFTEFKWYPTKGAISKAIENMHEGLSMHNVKINTEETWIEVRNPYYTIPFMMKSGVFVDINEES